MIQVGDMVRVKTREEILSMPHAYVDVLGNVCVGACLVAFTPFMERLPGKTAIVREISLDGCLDLVWGVTDLETDWT